MFTETELTGRKNRGDDMKKERANVIKATGTYYRLMIGHVRKVLGDIQRVVPGYDPKQGYHYLGAAKIMAPIGKAFAEAMVKLQKTERKQP